MSGKHPGLSPSKAPLVVAGVMLGGTAALGVWSATQLATSDSGVLTAIAGGSASVTEEDPAPTTDPQPAETFGQEVGGGLALVPSQDGVSVEPDGDAGQDDVADLVEQALKDAGISTTVREPEEQATAELAEVYVIQPGDTLSAISGRTGVPIDKLAADNAIPDVNLIYAGASLVINPVG